MPSYVHVIFDFEGRGIKELLCWNPFSLCFGSVLGDVSWCSERNDVFLNRSENLDYFALFCVIFLFNFWDLAGHRFKVFLSVVFWCFWIIKHGEEGE